MIEDFIRNAYKDRYGEEITEGKDKVIFSLAVPFFAIGGMVGGISGGYIANTFGRYFYMLKLP